MQINPEISAEFEQLWRTGLDDDDEDDNGQGIDRPANMLDSLTDEELNVTTDQYRLNDATARYLHIAQLVHLWYHAKLGESLRPLLNPISVADKKLDQEYFFDFDDDGEDC